MPDKYINCPYCGEAWSVPEVQDQECYECGYPNPVIDPKDALKSTDNDPEQCDTMGGLTPFFDAPKPPKGGFESATRVNFIHNSSLIIHN